MSEDEELPPSDSKLTLSKERWAKEGRFLTGQANRQPTGQVTRPESERLPPGQHRVNDWPVLDLGVHPNVAQEKWRLRISGLVEKPITWDWASFTAQPQSQFVSDVHCVTTWSRFDNRWDGVATRNLLEAVGPKLEVKFVILHAFDSYTTNLPIEDFAAADALLAHSWEGKPLTREHGGPVRLVVPHLYFWKSAKWISRIDFRTGDEPGFWETRGYNNYGDPWREQRYSDED